MIFWEREREEGQEKKGSLPPNQTINSNMCRINMKRI